MTIAIIFGLAVMTTAFILAGWVGLATYLTVGICVTACLGMFGRHRL